MMTQVLTQPAQPAPTVDESALVPQPDRPSQFPVRVPIVAEVGGSLLNAEVLGSTNSVLLLQGESDIPLPALGTPIRLRVIWDQQVLIGRLAAHGVASRFLVTMGERAIRRSRRFRANLQATAKSAHLFEPVAVRIVDLSTRGARIEGLDMAVGTELELSFTPPGRPAPVNVLAFVVRTIENTEVPTVGIAFRLVQPAFESTPPGRGEQR